MENLKEEIIGAVARGWCDPKNSHKIMDPDLAFAISTEVMKVLETNIVAETDKYVDIGMKRVVTDKEGNELPEVTDDMTEAGVSG